MSWRGTLLTGWSSIRAHSMRSLLTTLGILIGIAAVILTVGLGLGTQKDVSAQSSSLGSNLLIVTPGSSTDSSGMRGGFGSAATLTTSDVEALDSSVPTPDVDAVAAERSTSLSVEAGDTNWTTTVTGVIRSTMADAAENPIVSLIARDPSGAVIDVAVGFADAVPGGGEASFDAVFTPALPEGTTVEAYPAL